MASVLARKEYLAPQNVSPPRLRHPIPSSWAEAEAESPSPPCVEGKKVASKEEYSWLTCPWTHSRCPSWWAQAPRAMERDHEHQPRD
jgi:hypothetical protein